MGSPYSVDVVLFHENQVSLEPLVWDGAPKIGMVFMPVDASQLDGISVDREYAIEKFNAAETDSLGQSTIWHAQY